jgi:hypothetical protein
VLLASLRGLRAHGQHERYMAALDPRYHGDIASLTAPTWLPMDLALAHYRACDSLDLPRDVIEAIGGESGVFINQTVLSVVARLSKGSGVDPWFALANSNKLCARTWVGGSFSVTKIGPKEAHLEWIQQPVARIPYFRTAFGAFTRKICGLFADVMYVRELPHHSATELGYRMSWV